MINAATLMPQFDYAKAVGWLPFYEEAAKEYGIAIQVLLAISSRETNIRNILGDYGRGAGVMQVDVGTAPGFIQSGAWKDPKQSILIGSSILADKIKQVKEGLVPENDLVRVAVACYNAGGLPIVDYHKRDSIDLHTTHHNYSADVMARSLIFAEFLEARYEKPVVANVDKPIGGDAVPIYVAGLQPEHGGPSVRPGS
jgi:soluble lytic murein transglycosylase-like protein